jgi:predicted small integral membrane protein
MFNWMAWTPVVAIFFSTIALILVGMTVYEVRHPCVERRGFLPISTTRGDRLFIGLLMAAYIHLGVLAVSDMSLWIPLGISVVWLAIVMRWG